MSEIPITPKTRPELSEGLLRQRRNLLLTCLCVFVFLILDVEFEKVSILGNTGKINNSESINYLLIVFNLYFLWRYWQYLIVEDERPPLGQVYARNLKLLELPLFTSTARKLQEQDQIPLDSYLGFPRYANEIWGLDEYYDPNSNVIPDHKVSLVKTKVCFYSHINKAENYIPSEHTKNDWGTVSYDDIKEERRSGTILKSWLLVSTFTLWILKAKAAAKYIFKQHYFLDYDFPIIISCIVLLMTTISLY